MKKLLALLLVLTLVAVLAACGGGGSSSTPPAQNTPAESTQPTEDEPVDEGASADGGETEGNYEDDPTYQGALYLYENATAAYIGVTDAGEDVVFIETEDMAALAIANADMQSMSFVGAYEVNDTFYTIYDDANGLEITFEIVEATEDGELVLDVGELGQIGLAPTDAETAVSALLLIAGFTDAVL